jgi:hypothetical protein
MAQTILLALSSVTKLCPVTRTRLSWFLFHDVSMKGHIREGASAGSLSGHKGAASEERQELVIAQDCHLKESPVGSSLRRAWMLE